MDKANWTRPSDLVAQLRKHWDTGRILAERLDGAEPLFPLTLRLKKATSRDLDQHFEAVRHWVGELIEHSKDHRGHGYEIKWRTVNHPIRGSNQLPASAIDTDASGARAFNRRYGLAIRPALVRFRILDPALQIAGLSDLSVPASEFARLNLPVSEVFITENEINGLAFPNHPDAIVIFGLGYGLDRLAGIDWLGRTRCWYWGDIDTHGFAILNRLRRYLPEARSFLMDRSTLDAHPEMWGQEPEDRRFRGELSRLDTSEQAVYQTLSEDILRPRLRLEQEHVRFAWLRAFLEALNA